MSVRSRPRRPRPRGVRFRESRAAYGHLDDLQREYAEKRDAIRARLEEFREKWRESDESLFEEVAYCILAIQTKARASDAAVRGLKDRGLLIEGDAPAIAEFLRPRVRFHNHKAAYLVAARERLLGGDLSLREWLSTTPTRAVRERLVRDVDGLGYKEASHFLRNVGRGEDLAILDRHVLRNLRYHGVIHEVPRSLSRRRYLTIEEKVRAFSAAVGIPMAALDLVLWSRETGEVFK